MEENNGNFKRCMIFNDILWILKAGQNTEKLCHFQAKSPVDSKWNAVELIHLEELDKWMGRAWKRRIQTRTKSQRDGVSLWSQGI